jgi:hypothetical protein
MTKKGDESVNTKKEKGGKEQVSKGKKDIMRMLE